MTECWRWPNNMNTDIIIIGSGAAGLYTALKLPRDRRITVISKDKLDSSDSFLAQGGICVLRDGEDYDSFFEDTLRAGHYENDRTSVDIMIRSSRSVIDDLVSMGVDFEKNGDDFAYTREGAHSKPRILFHRDETGREITRNLLAEAQARDNITLIEDCTMVDLIVDGNLCRGVVCLMPDGSYAALTADYTVLATGGIGGLFEQSTNFPHLTGDALALALKYGIKLKNIDYIQIHPTSLYTGRKERAFLISESVRGEGAHLLNSKGERFVNELLPRDVVAQAIFREMEKEGTDHVWLSLKPIPESEIRTHFVNIYNRCLEEGYDITRESIPVRPAQHYFMGGVEVDYSSRTSMDRLYAVGETACNGVHGKNRLASNSLLESLVFALRAAEDISGGYTPLPEGGEEFVPSSEDYRGCGQKYKDAVIAAIEKEKNSHE